MAIHNIVIHTAAQLEFRESYDWYEAEQAGLGKQFAAAVRVRLTDIVANPHRGIKTMQGYRDTLVDNTFPFLLVFLLSKDETE